jgi:hypothetical protein
MLLRIRHPDETEPFAMVGETTAKVLLSGSPFATKIETLSTRQNQPCDLNRSK